MPLLRRIRHVIPLLGLVLAGLPVAGADAQSVTWGQWNNHPGNFSGPPACARRPGPSIALHCLVSAQDSAGRRGWFSFALVGGTFTVGQFIPRTTPNADIGNCLFIGSTSDTAGVPTLRCVYSRTRSAIMMNAMMLRWDHADSLVETRSIGGYLVGTPRCLAPQGDTTGILDCFALNKGREPLLYLSRRAGVWDQNWTQLGARSPRFQSSPRCIVSRPTQYDCFIVGTDSAGNAGALLNVTLDASNRASWQKARWQSAGGSLSGGIPSCVVTGPTTVECMARGSNGQFSFVRRTNGVWSAWGRMPQDQLSSPVSCVSTYGAAPRDTTIRILCASRGLYGSVHTRVKTAAGWQPPTTFGSGVTVTTVPECFLIGGTKPGRRLQCVALMGDYTLGYITERPR